MKNLQKLNPWNWFKHEENVGEQGRQVPVTQNETAKVATANYGPGSLLRLHREMDRLFDDAFGSFGLPVSPGSIRSNISLADQLEGFYQPSIDVAGNQESYEVKLDVPGLAESDLSIEVRGDRLVIQGQTEARNETKEQEYYRMERSYGAFQRTLSLPEDANAADITAHLNSGVLTLSIPRTDLPESDVRKIEISV